MVKAADWFLKLVEILGKRLGWSAFIVGVVLVGFGTSLPELATSISSVINNNQDVTIANIIGSNMANILLVLGLSTFFLGTITFKKNLIDLDLPFLFCASLLFSILIFDGNLSLFDGCLLLAGFLFYLLYNLSQNLPALNRTGGLITVVQALFKAKHKKIKKPKTTQKLASHNLFYLILGILGSIVLLAAASRLAILNMLEIAQAIELGVGVVTFVTIALGTSLPELLVTFKALKQNKGDLVLGNIIGSSVFNILLVGGLVAVIEVQLIDATILFWSIFGVMVAAVVAIVSGITKEIHLWQGVIFILIYIALISKIIAS